MFQAAQLKFINEETLLVEFGETLEDDIYQRVLNLDAALNGSIIARHLETLPTFRSLMIRFDASEIAPDALLLSLADLNSVQVSLNSTRWRVPICFEGECAEDLSEAAKLLNMPEDTLISRLLAHPLRLYMYGFAPGFAYLGGLDEQLTLPRRKDPRAPMPVGALMIAGGLASITSVSMPTGWYVLGQTPLTMFSAEREPMVPFAVGDELHLYRISLNNFSSMQGSDDLGMIKQLGSQ